MTSEPALDTLSPDAPGEPAHLDDQLCFALYAASRAMTRLYRTVLTELDLTYPQYLVLLLLWERDDVTVSALGDRLMLDSGTLSPLLTRLEGAGLVVRRRSERDHRAVHVALTEDGLALRARAASVTPHMNCASGLDPADGDRLRGELHELARRLVQALPES